MRRASAFFSLFTSTGTLLCCALPALFVSLGAGATLAALVTKFPFLIWLSERKIYAFAIAGLLLATAGVMQYRARNLPCPVDREAALACDRSRKISLAVYIFSLAIYLTGATFAYLLPLIG